MSYYRSHVLICGGTGCTSSKSREIKKELELQLERLGLEQEVQVVMTGCFGLCEAGPIMIVYPEGTFYSKVQVSDAKRIAEEHLLKGRIIKDLLFKEAIEDGINEEDAELLSPFYNDASLIKSIVETDDYKNTKQAFNCLVEGLSSSPSFARFAIENQVIPLINTRVNARRLFDFLSLSLEDALSIKNNKTPILKSKIELIKNYDVSISSIEEALTNVLTLRGEIESNINLGLLLTHLISLICKE